MYPDFEELLEQFNSAGVEYLIGGAHALALHARPRATKDLNLYIAPNRRNATRVVRALAKFFGGTAPSYVSVENLLDPTIFVQLGVAPVRVDLLPKLFTTTFAAAWKGKISARFGRVPAYFLSRSDLIAEKRYFSRTQDLADLEQLEARATRRPKGVKARRARKKS